MGRGDDDDVNEPDDSMVGREVVGDDDEAATATEGLELGRSELAVVGRSGADCTGETKPTVVVTAGGGVVPPAASGETGGGPACLRISTGLVPGLAPALSRTLLFDISNMSTLPPPDVRLPVGEFADDT